MAKLDVITKHFDQAAQNYNKRSLSFPWSLLRDAEWRAVSGLVDVVEDKDLLDLGCGAGLFSRRFCDMGVSHVHAVDISPNMIVNLKGELKITALMAPIDTLNLHRQFDLIVAAGLLEFLDQPEILFKTAMRHAKSSTQLLLLYPYDGALTRFYKNYHHRNGLAINVISDSDLIAIANKCGWAIIKKHRASLISSAAAFGVKSPQTEING